MLGGVIGASRAVIHHKNERQLVPADQGRVRAGRRRSPPERGGLSDLQEFDVYNGAIQPGSHTQSVSLQYQGNGFGVFSYLKGYKFNVVEPHLRRG